VCARVEFETISQSKALVEVHPEIARAAIRSGEADVVILFPIYEEKIKEGKKVLKVRLVGNGKSQNDEELTYSPTPSREELLILLHIIAVYGWQYCHIDEKRAFLNAKYRGNKRVFARLKHDKRYFEVHGALYGLKTSPRHYHATVVERLESMGLTRLLSCSCLFVKKYEEKQELLIVYDYVDDFIITGTSRQIIEEFVQQFKQLAPTTPEIWNATSMLGMEIERDIHNNLIKIYMTKKIEETCELHGINPRTVTDKYVPIPMHGYIVEDDKLDAHKGAELTIEKQKMYMRIVGSLVWISGIRADITFATMYLSWHTKSPKQHHWEMALYTLNYIYKYKDIPLVLGGTGQDLKIHTYTDSSLGTGPKMRSISGQLTKLNAVAGAINAKSSATSLIKLSSFESELDAFSMAVKTVNRVANLMMEIGYYKELPVIYTDNKAMQEFVEGKNVSKMSRHMELRLWYTREQYLIRKYKIEFIHGDIMPADKLTKLGTREDQEKFMMDILGLKLLPECRATTEDGSCSCLSRFSAAQAKGV
jgi:hypothetical protein